MRTWMFVAVVALMATSLARADEVESNRDASTARGGGASATHSTFGHSSVSRDWSMARSAGAVANNSGKSRISQIADKSHQSMHH